jgi:hypothetical protein
VEGLLCLLEQVCRRLSAWRRFVEVSAVQLAQLLGITQRGVQDAAARRILVRGSRGKYQLVASVRGYCGT